MIRRRDVLLSAPLLAFGAMARQAVAQTVVHGADQRFSAPTVRLAWAIERGATEATTTVVIRIANVAGSYAAVRVDGIDPFSKARAVLVAGQPLATQLDVRIARSRFAEFPSTEIHLFASATAAGAPPALTIFYLGVPDTTPEFTSAAAADADLARAVRDP